MSAVCKSNVELHKGSVSVHSEGLGLGSTFSITLPIAIPVEPIRTPNNLSEIIGRSLLSAGAPQIGRRMKVYVSGDLKPESAPPTPLRPSLHSDSNDEKIDASPATYNHVLIVDDVPMNRKMLHRVLEASCRSIEEAGDGDEAVAKVQQSMASNTPFDAITMDFQMPNMDGPTATKLIRDMGYTGIILGVTGNALPDDVALFISKGANRVLLKPVSRDTILTTLSAELKTSTPSFFF